MAGSLVARASVLERGKRQLDRDHLGRDLVDSMTVPHRGRIGGVELGAKVLVLAVQLVQLHGEAPRGAKSVVAQHRQGACRRGGEAGLRSRPTDTAARTRYVRRSG